MKESGYYPMGAEHDPRAPWNERENEPVEVSVEVYEEVRRTVTVSVKDYTVIDPEPQNNFPGEIDFEGCDLNEAYLYNNIRLSDAIKQAVALLIKWGPDHMDGEDWKTYKDVLEALSGWEDNELTIIKDEG